MGFGQIVIGLLIEQVTCMALNFGKQSEKKGEMALHVNC